MWNSHARELKVLSAACLETIFIIRGKVSNRNINFCLRHKKGCTREWLISELGRKTFYFDKLMLQLHQQLKIRNNSALSKMWHPSSMLQPIVLIIISYLVLCFKHRLIVWFSINVARKWWCQLYRFWERSFAFFDALHIIFRTICYKIIVLSSTNYSNITCNKRKKIEEYSLRLWH